jgi:hypothetical protein
VEPKSEVWAQIVLSETSKRQIHDFFRNEFGVKKEHLVHHLHITVYHARGFIPELNNSNSTCNLKVETAGAKFMVLSPGGEAPQPYLQVPENKIGIRFPKTVPLRGGIDALREEFYKYETSDFLGSRQPSSRTRNAFGTRLFQPHLGLVKPGHGLPIDLTIVGNAFREAIKELTFDRYTIEQRRGLKPIEHKETIFNLISNGKGSFTLP